jgi:hypothetical protein
MSRQAGIQKLILLYEGRLQILREKEAFQGLNTPPEVRLEIEDIEARLETLQTFLVELSSSDAALDSPPAPVLDIDRELARLEGGEKPQRAREIGGVHISGADRAAINIGGNVSSQVTAGGDIIAGNKTAHTARAEGLETIAAQWEEEVAAALFKAADLDEEERVYIRKIAARVAGEVLQSAATDSQQVESRLKKIDRMAPEVLVITGGTLQSFLTGAGFIWEKTGGKIRVKQQM